MKYSGSEETLFKRVVSAIPYYVLQKLAKIVGAL
jgi:hypothetical protein